MSRPGIEPWPPAWEASTLEKSHLDSLSAGYSEPLLGRHLLTTFGPLHHLPLRSLKTRNARYVFFCENMFNFVMERSRSGSAVNQTLIRSTGLIPHMTGY
jgi:hypothetical protein